jgi:hypothetical protein
MFLKFFLIPTEFQLAFWIPMKNNVFCIEYCSVVVPVLCFSVLFFPENLINSILSWKLPFGLPVFTDVIGMEITYLSE